MRHDLQVSYCPKIMRGVCDASAGAANDIQEWIACIPCMRNLALMSRRAFDLPPLELLVAFEAAARHLSFTRAADEIALTQSAVSRQIQALEGRLGARRSRPGDARPEAQRRA